MSDKTTKDGMPKVEGGIAQKPSSSALSPERIAQIKDLVKTHRLTLDELAKR